MSGQIVFPTEIIRSDLWHYLNLYITLFVFLCLMQALKLSD